MGDNINAASRIAPPELIMVVNTDRYFLSHRKEIALTAMQRGWDVTVTATDTGAADEIRGTGLRFLELPENPTGLNPFQELRTLRFLIKFYGNHPRAIVHHVGLKNILWGGIAARIAGVRGVVDAVAGLGTLFGSRRIPLFNFVLTKALSFSMRNSNVRAIFQNRDDEYLFLHRNVVRPSQSIFIKGSGIDLGLCRRRAESGEENTGNKEKGEAPLRVIFTGRMLREKGVFDLLKAAELLRSEWEGKAEFLICGGIAPHPAAISEPELHRLCDGRYIHWLGERNDIGRLLQSADIMAFPSYYREGVPKSLIEASAYSLPIVTTDSVGCRDTVVDGVNGFKVPPRSPARLAERLDYLLRNPDERRRMGGESRRIAERDYDIRAVVDRHLDIYNSLLK